MSIWNDDDTFDSLEMTKDNVISECNTMKQRLFSLVGSGDFNRILDKLLIKSKKCMKYVWKRYNTLKG